MGKTPKSSIDDNYIKNDNKKSTQVELNLEDRNEEIQYAATEFHLRDHFDWKIIGMNIFTKGGNTVYQEDFVDNNINIKNFELVNFMKSLQKFGSNSLGSELIGICVNGNYFTLDQVNEYYKISSYKLGNGVLVGKNSLFQKEIEKMRSSIDNLLDDELDLDDYLQISYLKEDIQSTLEETNNEIQSKFQVNQFKDFFISMVIITSPSGIPVVARSYDRQAINNEDPFLISSFLHALNLFFNTHFETALEFVQFSDSKFYIKQHGDYFYGILVNFDREVSIANADPINIVGRNLIDQLIQSTSLIASMGNLEEHVLNPIVDNFVTESILDVKDQYYSDLKQFDLFNQKNDE